MRGFGISAPGIFFPVCGFEIPVPKIFHCMAPPIRTHLRLFEQPEVMSLGEGGCCRNTLSLELLVCRGLFWDDAWGNF